MLNATWTHFAHSATRGPMRITPAFAMLAVFANLYSGTAIAGQCSFQLYSRWLNRNLPVCQTFDERWSCGVWPGSTGEDANMAIASSTGQGGSCDTEEAVGVCLMPGTQMYFYAGDPAVLAGGCGRMQGEWRPIRAATEAVVP